MLLSASLAVRLTLTGVIGAVFSVVLVTTGARLLVNTPPGLPLSSRLWQVKQLRVWPRQRLRVRVWPSLLTVSVRSAKTRERTVPL